MNLHRAKGLEAPIVVLAELGSWRKPDPEAARRARAAGSRGWFTAGYWMRPEERGTQWVVTATPPDWENRRAEEIGVRGGREDPPPLRRRDAGTGHARREPSGGQAGDRSLGAPEVRPEGPSGRGRECSGRSPPRRRRRSRRSSPGRGSGSPTRASGPRPHRSRSCPSRRSRRRKARARRRPPRTRAGAAWGRVLHQLLEAAMRTPGLALRPVAREPPARGGARPRAPRRGAPRRGVGHVVDRSGRAREAAKRRFVEAPFAMMVPSAELGVSGGPEETLLKGAIDLVFEEDGVWHIVDWKSDVVGDNLAALVAHYAPQIAHYRRAWEALTKQRGGGRALLHGQRTPGMAGRRRKTEREDSLKGVKSAAEPEAGTSQAPRPAPRPGLFTIRRRLKNVALVCAVCSSRFSRLRAARRRSGSGPRAISSNGNPARLYVPKLWAPLLPGSVYPNKRVHVPAKGRPSVVVVCPAAGDVPEGSDPRAARGARARRPALRERAERAAEGRFASDPCGEQRTQQQAGFSIEPTGDFLRRWMGAGARPTPWRSCAAARSSRSRSSPSSPSKQILRRRSPKSAAGGLARVRSKSFLRRRDREALRPRRRRPPPPRGLPGRRGVAGGRARGPLTHGSLSV